MKVISYIIFIGILSCSVFGQGPNIQWSTSFQSKKDALSIGLLGSDSSTNSLYFLKETDGNYTFLKYVNNKLALDKQLNLSEFKEKWGNEFNVINSVMMRDRFVFLMLFVNGKKSTANLFLLDISFDGEFMEKIGSIAEMNANYRGKLNLAKSPNSDNLVAWAVFPKQKGIDKTKLLLKTFDSKLNEATYRELNIPGIEDAKVSPIGNILIDNDGGVTILGFVEKKIKGYHHDSPMIWYLKRSSLQPIPIQFALNEIDIEKYQIVQNKIGDNVFEGFYNLPNIHEKRFKGYFYGAINTKDLKLDNLKLVAIPSEIQHPPYSTDGYFPEWNVIQKQNGGQIWIYEYQWVKSNNPHLGELFILNINNDGSLEYSTSVHKNQSKYLGVLRKKSFLYYYSYLAEYNDPENELSILFNEGSGKNLSLFNIEIDYMGHQEKTSVKSSDESIIFSTGFRIRLESGELILGIKNDELWFGTLKGLE